MYTKYGVVLSNISEVFLCQPGIATMNESRQIEKARD